MLELRKLIMLRAYYEQLLPRYGDNIRLCFTNTDKRRLLSDGITSLPYGQTDIPSRTALELK